MKSKASLTLIEIAVMLLIFSLAAAFCLKGFVWADRHSAYQAKADRALEQAQLAAEWVKYTAGDLSACQARFGGELSSGQWLLHFDESWAVSDTGSYTLQARKEASGTPKLGFVRIEVTDEKGERLAFLEVYYQEVTSDA